MKNNKSNTYSNLYFFQLFGQTAEIMSNAFRCKLIYTNLFKADY